MQIILLPKKNANNLFLFAPTHPAVTINEIIIGKLTKDKIIWASLDF